MPKKYTPKGSRSGKGGKRARRSTTSKNGVDYHGATKDACPTKKWAWPTREGARTLLRALRHGGDTGSRVYRCPTCDLFHVGHLPRVVRDGRCGADEIYG